MQLWFRYQNLFIGHKDVQTSSSRLSNIVDFRRFATDPANNTVADYVWIGPDQCHDMHDRSATPADSCDFSQVAALTSTGDTFLSKDRERDHDFSGVDWQLGDLHHVE